MKKAKNYYIREKNETFSKCNLVLMYSFNYEYDFIEKAFPEEICCTALLRKRFEKFCEDGDNNELGFMRFYASLSYTYKKYLIDYILNESEEMSIGSEWEKYSNFPGADCDFIRSL
jgi:hypothetical protein